MAVLWVLVVWVVLAFAAIGFLSMARACVGWRADRAFERSVQQVTQRRHSRPERDA